MGDVVQISDALRDRGPTSGVRAVAENPRLWEPLEVEPEPPESCGWNDRDLLNLLAQNDTDLSRDMARTKRAFVEWRMRVWRVRSKNEARLRGLCWAWREARGADASACERIAQAWGLFARPETYADEDQAVRQLVRDPERARLVGGRS